MASVTGAVVWRVACVTATVVDGERVGVGADAHGAGEMDARTRSDSTGARDDATVSSGVATACEASAGVATASTTGAGSGVVVVAGVALAGEAVAGTVRPGVGGGSAVVALGDAAAAGEAVAGVAGVAAVVAGLAAEGCA
jgi:hypothetical protein